MLTEFISKLLADLTKLLADDLSPQTIICHFSRLAVLLNNEKISIEKLDCMEYYDDGELSLILLMKNEAIQNAQFELASKFRILERELQEEKGDNQFTELKTERFFFEYRNNRVIFHYNKRIENQRLIANLIEGYNLGHAADKSLAVVSC